MSLINKMLQDLDARGGSPGGAPAQPHIKLVAREERRPKARVVAGGALVLVALVVGGYFSLRALQRLRAVAVAAPVTAVPVKTVLLAPLPPQAPVEAAIEPVAPAIEPVAPAPVAKVEPPAPRKEKRAEKPPLAAVKKAEPVPTQTIHLTASQRAETEYRRGLATLQEGRTGDAIAALEQALQIDPRHEAARQTLVGLLIENKRPDDALRQLQQALGADPRQPAMAMLLARLQIERGGAGVDTLLRTLPYAAGNAEYHAFLAGALQRQQRHREAVEQYQGALRVNPNNGVWLMGLGISLQAEKRNGEALDAFQRARTSASLSPELRAFIDRKLLQLSQ